MYIIIHKYQRWSGNVETKQKYLKNMPKEKQKKPKTYQNMVCGSRGPKTSSVCFSRRSLSSDKSIKLICTLHVVFGGKNRQFLVFFFFLESTVCK